MKQSLADFTQKEKNLVKELYEEGYSVKEISEITKLSFYETIYVLKKTIDDINLKEIIACEAIKEPEVLIISDTHLGSIYENIDYLQEVYRYAQKHDIHTIIHGGDLIQSTIKNVKVKYQDEKKQLLHAIKVYPYSSDIENYILLGNHDYNTLNKGNQYMNILKERDDFHILGFKRAYILWRNHLISVFHHTEKYHLLIPNIDNELNLKGHSHKLCYKRQNSIDIPTLSDDILLRKKAQPGFLVGQISDQLLEVDSMTFGNSVHNDGPILMKKLEKTK